jgi:predicted transglutaminase-like cysteine proteinase
MLFYLRTGKNSPTRKINLAAIAAMALAISACTYQPPGGGTTMPVGDQARAPIGYLNFCQRHPDECRSEDQKFEQVRLTENRWIDLNSINTSVNSRVRPVTDIAQFRQIEYWQFPKGSGDCEDYVLEKRRLLIEKGWPKSALLIATARNRKGELHAVLIASTEQGDYVLDNVTNRIHGWDDTRYKWVVRQSTNDPKVWRRAGIDAPSVSTAALSN